MQTRARISSLYNSWDGPANSSRLAQHPTRTDSISNAVKETRLTSCGAKPTELFAGPILLPPGSTLVFSSCKRSAHI